MLGDESGLKKWSWVVLAVATWVGLASIRAWATDKPKHITDEDGKKKKIVYRSHTQLDFSGETVQGKVRAPEVFYIFQRKRSEAHHVVQTPISFEHHESALLDAVRRSIPK